MRHNKMIQNYSANFRRMTLDDRHAITKPTVRWRAAGRTRSRSFLTRALAESYRAELVRAARQGLEFDPDAGEPVLWAGPGPVTVTWYQHAAAYAAMKWPSLAAQSRASLAEALATVTPR